MLFPSLRLAYMVIPTELRAAVSAAKCAADRGSSVIEQAAVADLLESGAIDRHLRRLTRELQRRRTALVDALTRFGRGHFELEGINAGMHIVARIPALPWSRFAELCARALDLGLRLNPVRPHFLDPPDGVAVLLGFAAMPPAALTDAAQRLCRALAELDQPA